MNNKLVEHVQQVNVKKCIFTIIFRKEDKFMKKFSEAQQSMNQIFLTAMELFRENGYENTNIRQLATKADVSLGLVNHYFGSKRNLAYHVLESLIQYAMLKTKKYIEDNNINDELLYDAVATRVVNVYLSQGPYRKFYLDSLKEDIFFNYLENHSQLLLKKLQKEYDFEVSDDIALLYGHYIPFIVEKTLYLKRNEGLFTSIPEDDIPFQIFNSTYAGRIPQHILEECDTKARKFTPIILKTISPIPSIEDLEELDILPLKL